MTPVKVHLIAAARPNFMKVAPLYHALKATDWAQPMRVHTGQHYDVNRSANLAEVLSGDWPAGIFPQLLDAKTKGRAVEYLRGRLKV